MAKKNSPATITLTLVALPSGTKTPKGHSAAYAAMLPEGIVGVIQGGKTAREVLLISQWAEKAEKDPEIDRALNRLR